MSTLILLVERFVLQEIGKDVEVVKKNNRSGSYIFNGCSVQLKSFARTD